MIIKTNFPLREITTFKLGGLAKYYLQTSVPEEVLAGILTAQERKIKYLILGGGSNVVFSDRGFNGLVIHFTGAKLNSKNFEVLDAKQGRSLNSSQRTVLVELSAGLNWHKVVKKLSSLGLAGTEKMSAIPGNVGGFVVGNAGAYGQNIANLVQWVEIFDGQSIRKIKNKDCKFDYRDSIFKKNNWLVLRVCLKLRKGDKAKLQKEVKDIAKLRWGKFGQSPLCAGSFFKNVEFKKIPKPGLGKIDKAKIVGDKIPAGYLIGEALKNKRLKSGGIYMAEFHNNFLMNNGTGTTKDLIKLATQIKQAVKKKFGIELEEEVRYIL